MFLIIGYSNPRATTAAISTGTDHQQASIAAKDCVCPM